MADRVRGGGGLQARNPFGPDWSRGAPRPALEPRRAVTEALFGRPRPRVLDPGQYPSLAGRIQNLLRLRRKLSFWAGDDESDYPIYLAEDTLAAIDGEGRIYMGVDFLDGPGRDAAVLAGALAHEIGHRPRRWRRRRLPANLSRQAIWAICREEEAGADTFAGRALAELELPARPLGAFLTSIEQGPHPAYYPAAERADMIAEAHEAQSFRLRAREKLYPEQARQRSLRLYIGEV